MFGLCMGCRAQLRLCYSHDETEESLAGGDEESRAEYQAGGGFPFIADLAVTYDFDKHIGEQVDKDNITGYACFRRLFDEPTGAGRPTQSRTRSTEVHHVQLYKPVGGELAELRYKTSAQSRTWYPLGANGRDAKGLKIFVEHPVLPELDDPPPLAPISNPWKKQDVVKACILGMHDLLPHFMNEGDHEKWVDFFAGVPQSSADVRPNRPASSLPT